MADRYWVGGTGNWSDNTNHWSASSGGAAGASLPTSSDNAIFDSASHNDNYTVTVDASADCADLTLGAPSSGALTFAGSSSLSVYGSFSQAASTIQTKTGSMSFRSTATGKTITCNGVSFANLSINFNGVGGGWTLQDAVVTGNAITLSNGALDTNDQTVTCAASGFNISGSNTRTLSLGSSTINTTAWLASTTTNLTFNPETSTIVCSDNFEGGALTYNDVSVGSAGTFTGANTFADLTITGAASLTAAKTISADQTITGTFTVTGNSQVNRVLIHSGTVGTTRTITAASVSLTDCDFEDITAAGAASPFTGTRIGDCGGNTDFTFTGAVTRYWVGDGGNWSDTSHWSASSGGASGATMPLPQDTAVFDANSFSSGGQTVTVERPRLCADINFTGVDNTPTWALTVDTSIYGSLTMVADMALTQTTNFRLKGRGTSTLTSGGQAFPASVVQQCPGGVVNLGDDFLQNGGTTGRNYNHIWGTLNVGAHNFTCVAYSTNNSNVRTLTMGSGTWTLTGTGTVMNLATTTNLTMSATTAIIVISEASTTSKTFQTGGLTYGTFRPTGDNIIIVGSPTFAAFNLNNAGMTTGLKCTSGITVTITGNFTNNGSAGNLTKLLSVTGGSAHNLSKAAGVVDCDYMSIQDSAAAGGADWYAGDNSTDVSGNSGWIFDPAPDVATGYQNLLLLGVG